jgi:hypothetical protein
MIKNLIKIKEVPRNQELAKSQSLMQVLTPGMEGSRRLDAGCPLSSQQGFILHKH